MSALRRSGVARRTFVLGMAMMPGLAAIAPGIAAPSTEPVAHYEVRLIKFRPLQFRVTADLPIDGDRLDMAQTYPAELPEMAKEGWLANIRDLRVTDERDRPLQYEEIAQKGWRLAKPAAGRVRLRYTVDLGIFAAAGWPSPRESAIVDDEHVVVSCRALFVTTSKSTDALVRVRPPVSWRAVAPWPEVAGRSQLFRAASTIDLTDNMLVISKREPDVVRAGGFTARITAMGHWRPLRPALRATLSAIIERQVAMMGHEGDEAYNVVLLPMNDTGGEAYRQTFAYAFDGPTMANRAVWANTMAHEIFHYWNYARLRGADYASTQWFQEGFTEYVANLTLVGAGIVSPAQFRAKLAEHIAKYQRLKTTLEAIGTQKGPPLYSAGALVAFSFDAMIRSATGGRRSIETFFRNLWRNTSEGARAYAWADIELALQMTAPGDWAGFHAKYISGQDPLPLERTFALAGLQIRRAEGGSIEVVTDPNASEAARKVWKSIVGQA